MSKKRKPRKVKKKNKEMYWIGVAITVLLIISIGTMVILLLPEEAGDLPPAPKKSKDPHLNIENVFFQKAGEATRQISNEVEEVVIIRVYSYITNDGTGDARNVRVTALPLDDSMNLASDKVDKFVGNIRVNKTSESEFLVEVPKGIRHEVFLMIWEDGRVILKGTGSFMVDTNVGSSQEFRTTEIIGTRNDTDYDGMPDSWEIYYGLDPSSSEDAGKDADGDGISNRGEYMAGTQPREPSKDDDEGETLIGTGSSFSICFVLIMVIIVIVIIIIIIKASVTKKKEYSTSSPEALQQSQKQALPSPQIGPRICLRCGGLLQNLHCLRCGADYNQFASPGVSENVDEQF